MKRKFFMFLGAFFLIYLFNFFIPRLMPGDPFRYSSSVSGEDMNTEYSEAQIQKMREYYGMDKSLSEQLFQTVKSNLHGDFGMSIHYKMPVSSVIRSRLPWTLSVIHQPIFRCHTSLDQRAQQKSRPSLIWLFFRAF